MEIEHYDSRDSHLVALYRATAQDTPAGWLDAAILSTAHRATNRARLRLTAIAASVLIAGLGVVMVHFATGNRISLNTAEPAGYNAGRTEEYLMQENFIEVSASDSSAYLATPMGR